MARNFYDQASRYGTKLDAIGFLRWLLADAALPFLGWLDTRTLPFPGDPERTCDTVAHIPEEAESEPFALVLEFCTEPDGTMFGRLLVYLGQLWLELRPNGTPGRRYEVGAAVVNLTGRGRSSRDMRLRQTTVRTHLGVHERNLADASAADTLDGIADGSIARVLLAWVPLMQGGDDLAIIQRWKELAAAEPDAQRRGDY